MRMHTCFFQFNSPLNSPRQEKCGFAKEKLILQNSFNIDKHPRTAVRPCDTTTARFRSGGTVYASAFTVPPLQFRIPPRGAKAYAFACIFPPRGGKMNTAAYTYPPVHFTGGFLWTGEIGFSQKKKNQKKDLLQR